MRHQTVRSDYGTLLWKEYQWGVDYRLYDIIDHAYKDRDASFEYDDRGYLVRAIYDRKEEQFRTPDKLGNLYETKDKKDRVYKSARLVKTKNATYKYDEEGYLIEKTEGLQTWKYTWKANGLLESVSAPKNMSLYFSYDALGRRITKDRVLAAIQYVWDGNVLLHEWKQVENRPVAEDKRITWVFQDFVPVAKLQGGKAYSIISDHLGTPILAVDSEGMEVWNRQLDIYGRVRKEYKHSSLGDEVFPFVPFLYQGQYYDFETNLAYNRFRYYSPETGAYISQDPIGLAGENPTLYGYVKDSNWWVDRFGLDCNSDSSNKKRLPIDPNNIPSLFPDKEMNKENKENGKIIYTFEHDNKEFKIEFHIKHEGEEHYDGDHYHIKLKSSSPPQGRTKPVFFRLKNEDPETPALKGRGTFVGGDLLPEVLQS